MGMCHFAKIGMYISNLFVFQSIEYLIRSGESHVATMFVETNWIGLELNLVNK